MMKSSNKRSSALTLMKVARQRVAGHVVGTWLSTTPEGPVVTYPHNPHGPLTARATVPLSPPASHARPVPVLLVFEREQSDAPIVVGVLHETGAPADNASTPSSQLEALVDGERVVVEGKDEVVLRCGKASITLRRNGRVIIRGTYLESRSEGVNRIKGGSVQIN